MLLTVHFSSYKRMCVCVCLYASHRSVVGCPPLSSPAPANYLSLQSNAFSKKEGESGSVGGVGWGVLLLICETP